MTIIKKSKMPTYTPLAPPPPSSAVMARIQKAEEAKEVQATESEIVSSQEMADEVTGHGATRLEMI